jgi:hypothetical protein
MAVRRASQDGGERSVEYVIRLEINVKGVLPSYPYEYFPDKH